MFHAQVKVETTKELNYTSATTTKYVQKVHAAKDLEMVVMVWWLFPRLLGFGENVQVFISCLCLFFFFKVEISARTFIPLFMPGSVHSGSASRDDSGGMFPDKLCVSSFLDRFPHYVWTAA